MTSEQPIPPQHASPEQTASESLSDTIIQENKCEVAESNLADDTSVKADVSSVISDEVLRHRIRMLIEEKPKSSKFQSISTHPLIIALVGFFLSIILGGFITNYYTSKQKELDYEKQQRIAREQSFSDEFNKIRILKIGEVWEQIDKNEVAVDNLLFRANNNNTSSSDERHFDEIIKLMDEDMAIINKNRFWLGEANYNQLKNYFDITARHVLDTLLAPPGSDLSESLKKREQAKQDVLQIRSALLKGESELNRQSKPIGQ